MQASVTERTKLRPLAGRVAVRVVDERSTPTGLVIPDTVDQGSTLGTVIAVGPARPLEDGQAKDPVVLAGDTVVFSPFSGTRVRLENDDLLILDEDDVLAVVEGGH